LLFDDLVSEAEQSRRQLNAERFGGFGIDGHVKFRRLDNWQIRRLLTFQDASLIEILEGLIDVRWKRTFGDVIGMSALGQKRLMQRSKKYRYSINFAKAEIDPNAIRQDMARYGRRLSEVAVRIFNEWLDHLEL
jgi:hypothetical protein